MIRVTSSRAIPGLTYCFAATIFLTLVSVSPIWDRVTFLNASADAHPSRTGIQHHTISFGVFGFTHSKAQFGYDFPLPGSSIVNIGTLHTFTRLLALYPIAAVMSGLAFFTGLVDAMNRHADTTRMNVLAIISMVCTITAWFVSMTLFGVVGDELRTWGVDVRRGNADCFVFCALIALVFAVGTAIRRLHRVYSLKVPRRVWSRSRERFT